MPNYDLQLINDFYLFTTDSNSILLEGLMANPTLLATATVSAANTATRVTAGESTPTARVQASSFIIQALAGNAADVYIGDASVQSSTTKGVRLLAGSALRLTSDMCPNGYNLADLYFASTSSGAQVSVLYWQA